MIGKYSFSRRLQWIAALLVVSFVMLSCQVFAAPDQTGAGLPSPAAPTLPPAPTSTPEPAPTPTLTEEVAQQEVLGQQEVLEYTYAQDFSTVPEEWDTSPFDSDQASLQYQIRDGLFRWQVTTIQGITLWNQPDPPVVLPDGDFLYTVSIDFGASDDPAAAGVIFRVQDGDNFYYAKLTHAGEVSVYALQDGEWLLLVEAVQSEYFNLKQMNRLIVEETHGAYEVRVNDHPVVTLEDQRFQGGEIGLIVDLDGGLKTTITFDDVRVMRPADAAAGLDEEAGRPTLMPLGASYQTFTGSFNGIPYSLDHPFVFIHSSAGGWERLCLDAPEKLCVSVQPQNSGWSSAEAMAEEVITAFSSSVSDYQELHRQSTVISDGTPAYWVGYTYTWQGKSLEGSRLFVVVDQTGFDIAAEGEPVMMDLYQAVIKIMLESFRLKDV